MSTIEKTLVPCSVCGDDDYRILYPDELGDRPARVDYDFSPETSLTYQIVKCQNCGFIYTNPMPDLDGVYADTADHVYMDASNERKKTAAASLNQILRYRTGGRLLDVGCSTGIFLDAAQQHFETEGIELSRSAREIASERHTVHDRPLAELGKSESYDVVTLWGVIEHFRDPASEIQAIARALKPGGILVIYTGDVDCWLPRLLGKSWWWYMGMHLSYFSFRTCSRLLIENGLKVVARQTHTLYFQIRSLGNSLKRYRFGTWLSPILGAKLLGDIFVPVRLSGEMLLIARKEDRLDR